MLLKLFPDAEVGEDVAEDFIGADFAGDGAEVIEGLAEVLGNQIGRDAVLKAVLDSGEGFGGGKQGGVVTRVGDEDGIGIDRSVLLGLYEEGLEGVQSGAGLGGEAENWDIPALWKV